MESEDPVAMTSELRKLSEALMRFVGEFETHRSLLTQQCVKMDKCEGMLDEIRTSQKELESKLLEGSKIYVIGDANACQNQSTTVHSQESSYLDTTKDDLVVQSGVNHQQNLESDVNDVIGPPGSITSHDQFNEMPSQMNLKLRQLVEAAAIHVARENMRRGTPDENQDIKTPLQIVPESGSAATNDKRLCCTIAPSPSIYAAKKDYRQKQRQAEMDIVKATRPNRASYPIRTPPEKLLRCEFCPRLFEHHHSAILHMRSCKKLHDESRRIKECESQENSFPDLITVGQKINEVSSRSRDRRPVSSGQRMQRMIKCGHCERTFPTQHQVSSHERVHTGLRPYSCYVCSVKFAHGGNMIKHIKSKHPSENPYMCRYCQNNFKTHADVLQHRKLCAVHRALLKDRSESSSTYKKKSRQRRREGEETVTASEDENSRPSAVKLPLHSLAETPIPLLAIKSEVGEASEDENSHPSTAILPPHSSANTRQIEFDPALIPPMLLAIKPETEETVVTSSPPSSVDHNMLISSNDNDNSTTIVKSGSISETLETGTSVEHSAVAVNQLEMIRGNEKVDFFPD